MRTVQVLLCMMLSNSCQKPCKAVKDYLDRHCQPASADGRPNFVDYYLEHVGPGGKCATRIRVS